MEIFLIIAFALTFYASIVAILLGVGLAAQNREINAHLAIMREAIRTRITREELIKNLEESSQEVIQKVIKEMAN